MDVRVGVIGAGYWGANLIRACYELGCLESICESDSKTAISIGQVYPKTKVVRNLADLFETKINAVIVATPAETHTTISIDALRAGKHVFVEKPLALSLADGEKIAKAALLANRVVFVGHLPLYHPGIQKLRTLLADQTDGRVWHLRLRRLSLGKLREHENVWWSFAPHDIALMLELMGSEPTSVVAAQASRCEGLSDVAYADFTFENGRSAHVEVCWLDPEKSARLDVFCENGVFTFSDSRNGHSLVLRPFSVTQTVFGKRTISRGSEIQYDCENEEPLKAEIRAFVSEIHTEGLPNRSVQRGLAVLRALEMAEEHVAESGLKVLS